MKRILSLFAALAAVTSLTFAEPLKVGDPAPDFEMKGSDGRTYKLSDFKGKKMVVIAWYPKAFTPGCTAECKSLKGQGQLLKPLDVAYFTASTDTPETNKKFAESLGLDYPILSDPTLETAKAYGVVEGEKKTASRWTFYIDKQGKIAHIDKSVATASHGGDILQKILDMGQEKK